MLNDFRTMCVTLHMFTVNILLSTARRLFFVSILGLTGRDAGPAAQPSKKGKTACRLSITTQEALALGVPRIKPALLS